MQTRAILELYLEDPSIPGSSQTGYLITDHNRQALQISYDRVEKSDRMADGTLRRFITANKKKISTGWDMLPAGSGINYTADGNLGGAFLKSFYEENVYNPVWLKLTYAEESWTRAGQDETSGTFATPAASSTNRSFTRSIQNTVSPSAYSIVTASISATTSDYNATASITTNVPMSGYQAGDRIYIAGIDSIFNGTYNISSMSADKKTVAYSLSNMIVPINAFAQSTTSGSFNVDSTYWAKTGTVFNVKNAFMTSGSVINSTESWTFSSSSKNLVVATGTSSQTAAGRTAMARIKTTTSVSSKAISPLYAAVVGPAVSSDIVKCFITNFDYTIAKRLTYTDYVNISMEFTEI